MRLLLLITGILLLFATEILRVYFIMPFPGSQHANTIDLAYFIDRYRLWLRLLGAAIVAWSLYSIQNPARQHATPQAAGWGLRRKRSPWPKIVLAFVTILYAVVFYFFNFRFEADKMFKQPGTKTFATAAANTISPNRLIIGVVIDHQARAYPIQLIGYHHQVRDTIGNTPVMITYCTVCRTGRVYSPFVNGRQEDFRLVGMDHFNAMFEDITTKSWWQQATGAAIAGPLKNARLPEIPSTQSTLAEWLSIHPDSKIMQPDPADSTHYADLADYDDGTIKGSLEHRDSASWRPKSWVIGVVAGNNSKAYDWNYLSDNPVLNDSIGAVPTLIYIYASKPANFHVWSRTVAGQTLSFQPAKGELFNGDLTDISTHSIWNEEGRCIEGPLQGQQLQPLQSYQEFWHSWSHFHPLTAQYNPG